MAAAAAARKWWPARGEGARAAAAAPSADERRAEGRATRLALYLPIVLACATLFCAAIGFAVTQFSETHVEAEQRAALRAALDQYRLDYGDIESLDTGDLREIQRRAGLQDLRFDLDPAAEAGRQIQSLHNGRGRIIGWLSWVSDGALVGAMNRLWILLAVVGAVFAFGGFFAVRAARRLAQSLHRSHEMMRELASQDLLTGLPNRAVMLENLTQALANRRSGLVAFALIDLDNFREVNDTLGRSGGDAVLTNIAEHLRDGLPPGAKLGRFEEDELAVVMASDEPQIATTLGDAIRVALQRPVFIDRIWQITAGVGLAQAPDDGLSGEDLARRAGLALRAAKREGRGALRRFEPQIETEYAERRFLLHELQTAIPLQMFDVHYQPIVAAAGGAMIGVEALVRWTHPTRGNIPPSIFIPLAEQSGLMSQLGEIVLRRALADAARWPELSVAVNLSPVQIRDRWLVDLVAAVVEETAIAPSRVVLEITEGVLIDNPQDAQARLEALRALGVSIALDDFGTGYSSLGYLQRFPFDRIKIDRAFVASLGASASTGPIIQSIVTLGHALGMKVLAEGIENEEQRVLLRLAGCDEMQGYLFARPGPASEIDAALVRGAKALAG
jgi:diguanylate cyclase (GGDEF)-like protein